MHKKSSSETGLGNLRVFVAFVLCGAGALLGFVSFGANPPSGTISVNSAPLRWLGTASGTGGANGESSCVEGTTCDTYTLTVDPTSVWTGKRIEVRIQQASSADDTDLVIHKDDGQGPNHGPIIATSGNGAGLTEVGHINPNTDGTGIYYVHVIYFATIPGDQYHGSAEVVPLTPAPPPNAAVDTTNKIGYENFEAPGAITPVTVSTGPTVEWLGRNAGEPSVGVNWQSSGSVNGVTNMQSDLETLFIDFSAAPANGGGATATWANRPAPTQTVIDSDPIGFTDVTTGRAFAAELTATSPGCKISFTNTDGQPPPTGWTATTGPVGSGIDHETIGGGHYNESAVPPPVHPSYPNALYYCSQDLVTAFCFRSDNGGADGFNNNKSDTYTTECGGLHGHVKVSPAADGTVYLPNKDCTGNEAVVVSENNGVTWSIRPVLNATVMPGPSSSDPALAIDANGRAYFAMAANDASAVVAYSDDHGVTWQNIVNLSSALGLQNIRYPAAVAGDTGRAAVAFLGSTTAGDANASTFNGVWHLYVAHTFDGGATWTTTDATPNMPVQRGNIWSGGGANIGRNMLDFFDIAIDKVGRVQVGYVRGCSGANCAQAAPSATGNAYSATATIARQSSGKRLLAASDSSTSAATVPGVPFVLARRIGNVVHLSWSEADTGGSTISGYQILRSTVSGAETTLASVPGTQNSYIDYGAADSSKTYYYKVIATNSTGSSASNSETAAPFVGSTCNGVIIHRNDPAHPEAAGGGAGQVPQLLIDYVAVGEPYLASAADPNMLMFQMKVAGNLTTLPPTSRWRMVWDSFASPGQQFYVGMTSRGSGQAPTFEYGTIATAVVGLVVGVPQETPAVTPADPASNYNAATGVITIYVPKIAVGNPQPGDLLGAVNGRTFGDNDTFERSTQLVDHTFVKAQTDNTYPTATYTVVGNGTCAVQPTLAQSWKTHAGAGAFPITLPLTGPFGIEDRTGTAAGNHQVIITFPTGPVSFTSFSVTPGPGGTASIVGPPVASGNQVTVNLTGVSNAQLLTINLFGVTIAGNTGDVSVPMGVLAGDTNADGRVNVSDTNQTKGRSGQLLNSGNFRSDVNLDGRINVSDTNFVKGNSGTAIP